MNRKTFVIISVTGAISLAAALSTMSVALARNGRSADLSLKQSVVATSPDDQQTPEERRSPIVSGTVKSLSADSIVVTDSTGKDVTVAVNAETRFTVKGSADKTISQLLAGQEVTIFQDKDGIAVMVLSGEMPKPPAMGPGNGPVGPRLGPGRPRMGPGGPGRPHMRPGPGGPRGPFGGNMSFHAAFGTVEQISDTSVTIKLARPASGGATVETYAINSDTKLMPAGQAAISVGNTVLIVGDSPEGSDGLVAKSIMRAPSPRGRMPQSPAA